MAKIICLVALALILTALEADSTGTTSRPGIYRCVPGPYVASNGQLENNGPLPVEEMQAILNKAEKQSRIGPMTVEELLELADVSEAKCNLSEFKKRRYYVDISVNSAAANFIDHCNFKLQKACRFNEDSEQEAKDAVKTDRAIIEDFMVASKLEGKPVSEKTVKRVSENYFKSLPGKQEFVRDARRLHILDACYRVRDTKNLLWFFDKSVFLEWPRMCSSYHEYCMNRKFKEPKMKFKGLEREIYQLASNGLLNAGLIAFTVVSSALVLLGAILLPPMYKESFGTVNAKQLPRLLYKLARDKTRAKTRDPTDLKYKIYPVNY